MAMTDQYPPYAELFGLTLRRTDFRWIGDRNHEHCNLCSQEFNEDAAVGLAWGYATEDEVFWICPACLAEEGARYHWKVIE